MCKVQTHTQKKKSVLQKAKAFERFENDNIVHQLTESINTMANDKLQALLSQYIHWAMGTPQQKCVPQLVRREVYENFLYICVGIECSRKTRICRVQSIGYDGVPIGQSHKIHTKRTSFIARRFGSVG